MSLNQTALLGQCPQCNEASIFSGLLSVHDNCPNCKLDLSQNETADGPTFLVITLLGFLVTGLAVWVELAYQPAYWIHAVIWFPTILILSPLLLRVTKSMMISYQHELMKHD